MIAPYTRWSTLVRKIRGLVGVLMCLAPACTSGSGVVAVPWPETASQFSTVLFFANDGFQRELIATRARTDSISLSVEYDVPITIEALFYERSLEALDLSEGIVPRATSGVTRAVPQQDRLERIELGSEGPLGAWTPVSSRSSDLEAMRIDRTTLCPLSYEEIRIDLGADTLDRDLQWIVQDSDTTILTATNQVLFRVDIETSEITRMSFDPPIMNRIQEADRDPLGRVWFGGSAGELWMVESTTATTVTATIVSVSPNRKHIEYIDLSDEEPIRAAIIDKDEVVQFYDDQGWHMVGSVTLGPDNGLTWAGSDLIVASGGERNLVRFDTTTMTRTEESIPALEAPSYVEHLPGLGTFVTTGEFGDTFGETSPSVWESLGPPATQSRIRGFVELDGRLAYIARAVLGVYDDEEGFCPPYQLSAARLTFLLNVSGRLVIASDFTLPGSNAAIAVVDPSIAE